MRAMLLGAVALVLVLVVAAVSPWQWPEPAAAATSSARVAPSAVDAAAGGDAANLPPAPALLREQVPAAAPLPPLAVLLCEQESRAPLPRVPTKLWCYGADGNRALELRVDGDGHASIARALLDEASGIEFEVELPEFTQGIAVRVDEAIERLRRRTTPLLVLVARGRARELRVVDERGQGVVGAVVEADSVCAVRTDARGIAQLCLTVPSPATVEVCAPGRRLVASDVPPGDEPWRIVLPLANRLELALAGGADPRGHHAVVRLPAAFATRTFYQALYDQTPGRAVEGTKGWWQEGERKQSIWHLGFTDDGTAVLDQFCDAGPIEVALWRFDQQLELRAVTLPDGGGLTRLLFAPPPPSRDVAIRTLDADGVPRAGIVVRMAAVDDAVIGATLDTGFPVWAPRVVTDAAGCARLPAAASDLRVVCAGDGLAVTVLTVGELLAARGEVRLGRGLRLQLAVVDRDGERMVENACGNPVSVQPRAQLPHRLWLEGGYDGQVDAFVFTGLPAGDVEFHFTYLDEVLHHDPRVPAFRFVSRYACDELELGK